MQKTDFMCCFSIEVLYMLPSIDYKAMFKYYYVFVSKNCIIVATMHCDENPEQGR